MIERSLRMLYVAVGMVCLIIGVVGAFVPLLPTTPFVLLAAFFFSKGSRRLHAWLLSRPVLGPVILDWQQSGVIRRPAKISAAAAIVFSFGGTVAFVRQTPLVAIVVSTTGVLLLAFVLSRPSAPPNSELPKQ